MTLALLTLAALSLAAIAGYLHGRRRGLEEGRQEVITAIARAQAQARLAIQTFQIKTKEQAQGMADAIARGRENWRSN